MSVTCPVCNGSGERGMVIVHAKRVVGAPPMTEAEASRLQEDINRCTFCDGQKTVAPQKIEWRKIGESWRQARLALNCGLREWAEHVGCLPSDYSKMEQGLTEQFVAYSPLDCDMAM